MPNPPNPPNPPERDWVGKRNLTWLKKLIKETLTKDFKEEFNENTFRVLDRGKEPFLGGMFFFVYNAKYKDVLPYWDMFPIVIPYSLTDNGFYGLNLHYADENIKKILLKRLMRYKKTSNNRDFMQFGYNNLIRLDLYPHLQKCIHRYLTSHINSKIARIHATEWKHVVMLPTCAKWQKSKPDWL